MPDNLFSFASHCFVWGTLWLSSGCSVMPGNLMSSGLIQEASRSSSREPLMRAAAGSGYVFFNGTKPVAVTISDAVPQQENLVSNPSVAEHKTQPSTPAMPPRRPEPKRLSTTSIAPKSLTRKLIQINSVATTTVPDPAVDSDADVGRVRFDGVAPEVEMVATEQVTTKPPAATKTIAAVARHDSAAGDRGSDQSQWKEARTTEWKRVATRQDSGAAPYQNQVVQVSGRRPPIHRPMPSTSRPDQPMPQMVPQPVPMPCPDGFSAPCDCDPCKAATVHADQISALFKRVETMETDLKRSHQSISTLEKSLTVANSEIVRLKKDVDYWQTEFSRLEASVQQQHQDDIEALGRVSEMLGLLIENADVGAGNDLTSGTQTFERDTGLTIMSDADAELATGQSGGVQ